MLWLCKLLTELHYPQETPVLWCDNRSTVLLTKDPVFSNRAEHIEARYFFLRELSEAKEMQCRYILGAENPADIFTKPLRQELHWKHLDILG